MINSKQRSKLISLSMNIDALVTIGKNGVSATVLDEIDNLLEAREIVKINVLKNCDESSKELIDKIASLTSSEPVKAIGNKIVLYRRSSKKDIKHIELD